MLAISSAAEKAAAPARVSGDQFHSFRDMAVQSLVILFRLNPDVR